MSDRMKTGEQIQISERPFVGVFDSGLGGISVLAELISLMPDVDFEYYGDSLHAPYGTKSPDFVLKRALEICGEFVYRGACAVVIACNTATSIAAQTLREKYDIPIVGMEPAVKPALSALHSHSDRKIAVLATPMTLREEKYRNLVRQLEAEHRVVEIPSPELVDLVEKSLLDEEKVRKVLAAYYRTRIEPVEHLGAIVLGCTHFVFLKHYLEELSDGIVIVDGNHGTAKRLQSLIAEPPEGNPYSESEGKSELRKGRIRIQNSAGAEKEELSRKLLRHELTKEDYFFVASSLPDVITQRLDGREAEFAQMYYLDKIPLPEIAKKLQLSEKSAKVLLEKVSGKVFKYLKIEQK